jgi:UDP-glucose 4-epimerase/UDP-glucuronate decarboxylase
LARHLVTGAAGLIGFELARLLLERGEEVVCADDFRKGARAELAALAEAHAGRAQLVEADLARGADGLAGPFDAVFHFAAVVGVRYVMEHPYETLAVNARSTLAVTDLALRDGCRSFFLASSSENYAAGVERGWVRIPTPEDAPLVIDDVALPRWSYAASKIAAESAVFAAAGLGGFVPVILRFHNVYGPRMRPTHVIPEFVQRCVERTDPFPVYGPEQTRSFLYVDDAARAVAAVHAAVRERGAQAGGIYNVGCREETRVLDLARLVFDVVGFHPRIEERPAPEGSVTRRVPETGRLDALGFAPEVGLAEGIRRTALRRSR